jgi:uncharacterized protein YoxC
MNHREIADILAWVGTACWGVCFWWMHRISQRQDRMLQDLHEQTKRIEELSKAEHDLIKDVHPKVSKIERDVSEVADEVRDTNASGHARSQP